MSEAIIELQASMGILPQKLDAARPPFSLPEESVCVIAAV